MSDEDDEISRDELLRRYQQQAAAPQPTTQRRSPFKFLDSYGVNDADIFFGRDYEIEELLHRYNGHGCVLIYGESGAGKSSLVQCGLRSRIPSADALFLAPRVHGSGLPTICEQIYEMTGKALGVEAEIPEGADFHSTMKEVCDAASRPVVLFFDQFEELFIFHEAAERMAFAKTLAELPQKRLNVKVIIGIRHDYLAYLSELEDTVEGLFDNRFWLRRMARETAANAVVQACAKGSVTIAEDVANAILQRLDPAGEGVELPYLQVVMDRLFRLAIELNPENSSISIEDVEKLGDVANILGSFLVEEVGKLADPETGRQVLKAFVTQEGTRKSITRAAVAQEVAGFGGEIAPEVLDDLLERLARVRILREVADTDTFELRHDALAATVAGWITEVEKELIEVRDNVQNRFREWEARSQAVSALLDHDFLNYLDVFHQRLDPLLDDAMRNYIATSRVQLTRQKRKKRRAVGSVVLTVIAVVLAFGTFYLAKVTKARNEARTAHATAELNAAQAVKERTAAVEAKEEALEEKRRADESAEIARQAEAVAQTALGKAKEEKLRADREALEAKASREKAVAALAQAKVAETHAREAADEASKAEQAAVAAKQLADKAKANALAEKNRAERGERQQLLNLFESYLSQGILHAENADYAAAARSLEQAEQTAGPVAGLGVIPQPRIALRNTVAWLTDVSRIESEQTYLGASSPVKAVAVSDDGRLLAAGGEDGRLYLYAGGDVAVHQVLSAHRDLVSAVAFFPVGKLLATAGADRMIRLFDVSGAGAVPPVKLREWRASAPVGALAISPDGRWLVTGNEEGDVVVWDPATGTQKTMLSGHSKAIRQVRFSAAGNRLATASFDHTARLWNVSDKGDFKEVFVTPPTDDPLVSVALNGDGKRLATAGLEGAIRVWDVAARTSGHRFTEHRNTVTALEFFDEGRGLISAGLDRTIRIWDVDSGVRMRVLQGHKTGVTGLARHGDKLYSCGNDQTLRSWSIRPPTERSDFRVVDLGGGVPQTVAISPRHDLVVVGFEDGKLARYSLPDGKLLGKTSGHSTLVSRIAFSPAGNRLASGSFNGEIRLFAIDGVETRFLRAFSNHVDVINDLAFSPDGNWLATASVGGQTRFASGKIVSDEQASAGQVSILNLASGQTRPYAAHRAEALSVEFDRAGDRVFSTGDGGGRIIWRFQDGELNREHELPRGRDMIYAGRFDPANDLVATAGRTGVLEVFDALNQKKVFELTGHENAILRLAFTPDGGQLMTAGTDGTIRFWDMQLGRRIFDLRLPVDHENKEPLWDFDFDYRAGSGGWMAVPLTNGKLLLYRLGKVFDLPSAANP